MRIIAGKKGSGLSEEFKRVFRYFYVEVKKYSDKHYGENVFPLVMQIL